MLKRLFIDNWRCFTDFEMSFDAVQSVGGLNGTGKSSLVDLLSALKRFVTQAETTEASFPVGSFTRWSADTVQRFELDLEGKGETYAWSLEVEHDRDRGRARVRSESLSADGSKLFEFKQGTARLYRDDFTVGSEFRFDGSASAIGTFGTAAECRRLGWFRNWLERMLPVRINPFAMSDQADGGGDSLECDASNFASWYRFLTQADPVFAERIAAQLRMVWPTFREMRLEGASERLLKVRFGSGADAADECLFSGLSDGQRCLIVLYALLTVAESSRASLLALDEPVNFVTLGEIQPWLGDLLEAAEDGKMQLLLTGHHPGQIDYVGSELLRWLERGDNGPTRIVPFAPFEESILRPSEIISRRLETANA